MLRFALFGLVLACAHPAPEPPVDAVKLLIESAVPQIHAALADEAPRRGFVRVDSRADATLRVESTATFYAQVAGRYRWEVTSRVELRAADHTWTRTLQTPVFLVYYHEREPEALAAAAPALQRKVGTLLDEWRREAALP